jgi:integrase
MDITYDVRIYKTDVYESRRKNGRNTYWVRWKVGKAVFKLPYGTSALAESFRSELMTAARKGEAFRVGDGMPMSKVRAEDHRSWYVFACSYVDLKWKAAAATYRRGIAEAMVTVTMAMLTEERGRPPDDKLIRSALFRWGFNTPQRASGEIPQDVAEILRWVEGNTRPVGDLADKRHLRRVADAIASKLDGSLAAATVLNRKRAVLFNALDYAVEEGLLPANPLPTLKWTTPRKTTVEIDRRSVVNPVQARTLLNAIRETKRSGRQLYACFACSYFAALRPEEAVNLRRADISLPAAVRNARQKHDEPSASDWGEMSLRRTAPHAGREWTNSGRARDSRGLKHRAEGEERIVPIPPELTQILREHLDEFPLDADGRLFYGNQGGELPVITYNRIWHKARAATFVEDVLATPLARTPYTLRHAAVSTWLAGGVAPTQVAAWAGHSVEVLLKVYAKSLHGRDRAARAAMGRSYL